MRLCRQEPRSQREQEVQAARRDWYMLKSPNEPFLTRWIARWVESLGLFSGLLWKKKTGTYLEGQKNQPRHTAHHNVLQQSSCRVQDLAS